MNLQKWLRILIPEIQLFDYVQAKGFTGKKTRMIQQSHSANIVGATMQNAANTTKPAACSTFLGSSKRSGERCQGWFETIGSK